MELLRESKASRQLDPSPVASPVNGMVSALEAYRKITDAEQVESSQLGELQHHLASISRVISDCFSKGVDEELIAKAAPLCQCIEEEIKSVAQLQSRSRGSRLVAYAEDEAKQLECYSRVERDVRLFMLDMNLMTYQTQYQSMVDTCLGQLRPSFSAFYNSEKGSGLGRGACALDTRDDVLQRLSSWAKNPSSEPIYWLNGMAGTGKTTIAYSLCSALDAHCRLAASFFCSRMLPECRDINRIIPSIAYQMARFSRPFRSAIIRSLMDDPEAHRRPLEQQFESLIAQPLLKVREALPENLVVVLDALDECDDKQGVFKIMQILLERSRDLPTKFVVSSRPEPEVRSPIKQSVGRQEISQLGLHELDSDAVQGDIGKYLQEALRPAQPSESDIVALARHAGTSFIHAAAVVRYVGYQNFSKSPHRRLANVLNTSSTAWNNVGKELDELYALSLEAALDNPDLDGEDKEDTKRVLHTVLSVKEPLNIEALSWRAGIHDVGRVYAALQPLSSVICINQSNGLVSTVHASFRDFVSDPIRSKKYYCRLTPTGASVLTQRCFDSIQNALAQFNICGLDSSWIPDNMVENLEERVENAINSELSYACQHWAAHLVCVEEPDQVVEQLKDFLSLRLLLWLEVLNLQGCLSGGVEALRLVENWCIRRSCSEELINLAHDAWRFTMTFAASPASQSTPHIYVSMLPFWPKSSPIAQHYATYMRRRIIPPDAATLQRQSALLATWDFGGPAASVTWSPNSAQVAFVIEGQIHVRESITGKLVCGPLSQPGHSIQSIAFSSHGNRIASVSPGGSTWWWDTKTGEASSVLERRAGLVHSIICPSSGTRIISSLDDNTIGVCHALSGKLIPLHHPLSVGVVAHSSNSIRIVSGTEDGTIHLWDAQSGAALGSFKGHVSSVMLLSISAGGTRIISGSQDDSICVWDENGHLIVSGLVEGHSGRVTSVAFSPDGTRVVSGSSDNTVCLWDTESGGLLLGPLTGHTNSVVSVSFSPDSSRIMSNSQDGTIKLWDASHRQGTFDALTRHEGSVNSVALYSGSTGLHIVSGSHDKAIRMWNVGSGELVLGPLIGHTGPVKSVAISPDGTRMASGSDDTTICIWDAENGERVLGPLEGHSDSITSVGFSPNGALVLSGSLDKTIRIWDSKSGKPMIGPLVGHGGSVTTIVPSPDGFHLLSGSTDRTLRLWDTKSGRQVLQPFEGHSDRVTSVVFSTDGTRIASASDDKSICLWELQPVNGALDVLKGGDGWMTSVAFSSSGDFIISGSWDATICVWNSKTRRMAFDPLRGHEGPVTSVAISSNSSRIVSGSIDTTIRIWDAQSGTMTLGPLEGHTAIVTSVALSADGSRLVSGSGDKTVRVWDVRNGCMTIAPLTGHEDWVNCVAFSPVGGQIVSGSSDKTIRIWDPVGGQMLFGPLMGHTESVMSVTFSPNGRRVVSGSGDRSIRVWNAKTGELVLHPLKGHQGWVISVAVSCDGAYLASGSSDKAICVWSMQNGDMLLHFQGHTSWVSSLAFSPDGAYIVSGGWDKTIRIWDAQSRRAPLRVIKGHTRSVTSLSFSADSAYIVSASNDKTIRVWDSHSGQMVLGPLEGHNGMVTCVAFSPDNAYVVSGCTEGTIRLWDIVSRGNQTRALPPSSGSNGQLSPTLNKDGWVVDQNDRSRLLAWVPPDARHALLLPGDSILTPRGDLVRLDLDWSLVGEAWTRCYQVPDRSSA